MKLLDEKDIEECNYMSRNRARLMKSTVNVDYEGLKGIGFTVGDRWKHSVLYNKLKDNFSCTCKWYTMKGKPCAHIIAVNMWLKEKDIRDKNIKEV